TPCLQDNRRNLRQDFALPARQCKVRVLTGDELLHADQRALAPEESRHGSGVAIHQNTLEGLSRRPPRNQLAESAMCLMARFHNSHALAARRTVRLQYRRNSAFVYPSVQRTQL